MSPCSRGPCNDLASDGAVGLERVGLLLVGVSRVPFHVFASVLELTGLLLVGFFRDDRTRSCRGFACFELKTKGYRDTLVKTQ